MVKKHFICLLCKEKDFHIMLIYSSLMTEYWHDHMCSTIQTAVIRIKMVTFSSDGHFLGMYAIIRHILLSYIVHKKVSETKLLKLCLLNSSDCFFFFHILISKLYTWPPPQQPISYTMLLSRLLNRSMLSFFLHENTLNLNLYLIHTDLHASHIISGRIMCS